MSAQEDDELNELAEWLRMKARGQYFGEQSQRSSKYWRAAARLTAMREEIERKDEVLRPFAHYCELNDLLDSGDPERVIEVPVSDLQHAYAALIKERKSNARRS